MQPTDKGEKSVRQMMAVLMFGTLLLPVSGFTLGLGEIEVNSALNQQLDARIELLSAAPEDAEALIVELASREEFIRAGLDRPFALNDLKFSSYVENDRVYIKVKSGKPVREPFLNFLIEIDWPKGHLLREYTILLDPPVFMGGGSPASRPGSSRPSMYESGGGEQTPDRFSTPDQSYAQPDYSNRVANYGGGTNIASAVVPAPFPPEYASEPVPVADNEPVSEPIPEGAYPDEPVPEPVWLAQQSQSQMEPSYQQSESQLAPPAEPLQQASTQPDEWKPDKDYHTKKGDTAWSLADRMRPDESTSIQQMMLAMLRTNPEIFINGNVNGLKRGFILRVPDRNEINSAGETQVEARTIAQEHNALWREYRQALVGDVPASAFELEDAAAAPVDKSQDKEISAAAPVADAAIAESGGSRLSIVSAGEGSSAASSDANEANEKIINELNAQLAIAQESMESGLVEKEALQSQVASLEQQITKMQSLLNIQDNALAEAQSLGKPGMEGVEPEQSADQQEPVTQEPVAEEVPVTPEEPVVEEMMSEEDAMAALNELTEESVSEEPLGAGLPDAEPTEAAMAEVAPTDMEPVEEVLVETQLEDMPVEQPTEVEFMDTSPAEDVQQEPGLIDALLNNKLIIGAVILLLLIIAGAGYVMFKQFRGKGATEAEAILRADSAPDDDLAADPFDDLPSDEDVAQAAAEDAAEEEFDADATAILSSVPEPSAGDTVVTQAAPAAAASAPEEPEERDDVIAEADVYLAYGIYQQAEELLENAIKENPDKDSYRVKLAETYFASKNVEAMEKFGIEMQKHVGVNNTPAWEKVVAMGLELCPEAAVFKNAGTSAELDMDDIAPKSPEPMDFDLGDGAAEEADLDFDFDAPEAPEADIGELEMDETAVLPTPEVPDAGGEEVGLDELEFDIGEATAEAPDELFMDAAEDTASDDEFSLDIDSSELDLQDEDSAESSDESLDFDLDLSDAAGGDELSLDASGDGDDVSADLDLSAEADLDLSMDFDEPSSDETPEESSIEIDASELEDLSSEDELTAPEPEPEPVPEPAPAAESVVSSAAEAAADVDLGDIDVDEINTKLDLARAYLDMGDHEGTRDILDEVIAGGTAEQKGQAQELLKELG